MPSSERIYQIMQGTPITASTSSLLLSAGLTGTVGSRRRLVHPDQTLLPPLLYDRNPDRTVNFDNEALLHPTVSVVRTLTSTKTVRFEELVEDVIVGEVWEARGGLSVPHYFWREMYNYFVNLPVFNPSDPQYIVWEPRDRTTDQFFVELVDLRLGSAPFYEYRGFRAGGGPNDPNVPGSVLTPSDVHDVVPTEFLDRPMVLTMKIVAKVVA